MDREKRLYLLHTLLNSIVSVRVQGLSNIPKTGGALLVCNHTDLIDAVIQGLYCPRDLSFLAKAELFSDDLITRMQLYRKEAEDAGIPEDLLNVLDEGINLSSQMLEDFHILPIIRNYRSGNAQGNKDYYDQVLYTAREILERGGVLAMYPEGARSLDGSLQGFKGFAARLALSAGVPVVPATILGARGFSDIQRWVSGRNRNLSILYKIGEPILPGDFPEGSGKREMKELTSKIQTAVGSLMPRARRSKSSNEPEQQAHKLPMDDSAEPMTLFVTAANSEKTTSIVETSTEPSVSRKSNTRKTGSRKKKASSEPAKGTKESRSRKTYKRKSIQKKPDSDSRAAESAP